MRLHLVRHAIAEAYDPEQWPDDADRPLSSRGVERFVSACRGIRTLEATPSVVLASPYRRAAHTARLLEEHAGWPAAQLASALADGALRGQVDLLRGFAVESSVALVGHEPHLSRLASWLLTGAEAALAFEWRRGGLAVITLPAVEGGAGQLEAFTPPRLLRR